MKFFHQVTREDMKLKDKIQRFYTVGQILLAAFIGGPLAAGYLMSKNFINLGNAGAARKTLWAGIFATIILAIGIF